MQPLVNPCRVLLGLQGNSVNYRLGIYRQLTTKRDHYLLARLVSMKRLFMNVTHDWLECRGRLHINISFISS